MAITEETQRRAQRARTSIAGIIDRLAGEIDKTMTDPRLSLEGKAEEAGRLYETAEREISELLDGITERARQNLAATQSALDEYLDVTEDKLATKATIHAGLLARAHDHTDELIRVLAEKYNDSALRRLLTDTLDVVHAGLDGTHQRDLETQLAAAHAKGALHVTEREQQLVNSLHEAREFERYVDTIRQVSTMALRHFVAGQHPSGSPRITSDPAHARSMVKTVLDTTQSMFNRYEKLGRSVAATRATPWA